jgi:serine/threonine-protein kinase
MVPDAPEQLEHIVAKCLKKNPNDRYQSIAELAADLADLLGTVDAHAQAGRIARIASPAGEAAQREGTGKYDALRTRPMVAANLADKNGQRPTKDAIHTSPAVTLGQTGDAPVPTAKPAARSKAPLFAAVGAVVLVGLGAFALTRKGEAPKDAPAAAKSVDKPVVAADKSAAPSQPVATMAAASGPAASAPPPSASESTSASASAKKPVAAPPWKPTGPVKPNPNDDPFGSRK